MEKIDFVVTWVEGSDPEWLARRQQYLPEGAAGDMDDCRYRDWGLLRYWFRGVEAFAPWVGNIWFVTCGQYPEWLNREHPKLKLITHEDYIPHSCLPTFNSNVIELCLHFIPGLSERFVLFNDDMFLTAPVTEGDFFHKGLPRETVRFGQLQSIDPADVFPHTILNNTAVINRHFSKWAVQRAHWQKFYAPCYGPELWRNVLSLPYRHFSSFYDTHLPTSHRKAVFREVWAAEPELLEATLAHRFRETGDVTHWLMKNWQICRGEFVPRSYRWGKCFVADRDPQLVTAIREQKYKAICINDCPGTDPAAYQQALAEAFDKILPKKSAFEL